jgi:hypothetical protein
VADPSPQAPAQAAARRRGHGVSASLAQTISLYAAGLGLFSLATALRGRGLGRAHAAAAVVLGIAAVLGAVIAGARVALGGRPAEPLPFAGYLLLSVLAMPVGWRYARSASRGWDAATLAVATGALCVISVRLGRTWG